LLGAYALIQKYFVHPREPQNQNLIQNKPATPSRGPSVGTKISIPGVELNQNGKTLLLVISTKCRFCKESAGFYQKIVQEAQSIKDLRVIALLPQSVAESEKYLKEMSIAIKEVRQSGAATVGASAFPTLILMDSSGTVKNAWLGKLPVEKEAQVLEQLKM